MSLAQKLGRVALGLALLANTGCNGYRLIHSDPKCTMKANAEGQYHLQHQKVDGLFKPEQTYVFIVEEDVPTEILSYEDDRGFWNRRVTFDEEFDPQNDLQGILTQLKARDGPYRTCLQAHKKAMNK